MFWGVDAFCARLAAVLAWLLLIAADLATATCCADSPGHPGLCILLWLWLWLLRLFLLLLLVVLDRIPCGDDGVVVCHGLVKGRGVEIAASS